MGAGRTNQIQASLFFEASLFVRGAAVEKGDKVLWEACQRLLSPPRGCQLVQKIPGPKAALKRACFSGGGCHGNRGHGGLHMGRSKGGWLKPGSDWLAKVPRDGREIDESGQRLWVHRATSMPCQGDKLAAPMQHLHAPMQRSPHCSRHKLGPQRPSWPAIRNSVYIQHHWAAADIVHAPAASSGGKQAHQAIRSVAQQKQSQAERGQGDPPPPEHSTCRPPACCSGRLRGTWARRWSAAQRWGPAVAGGWRQGAAGVPASQPVYACVRMQG